MTCGDAPVVLSLAKFKRGLPSVEKKGKIQVNYQHPAVTQEKVNSRSREQMSGFNGCVAGWCANGIGMPVRGVQGNLSELSAVG